MQSQQQAAQSPSRAQSAKEKRAAENKMFNTLLKSLVQNFNVLVVLNTAMGGAEKGSVLAFPNPASQPGKQEFYILNRKHMRSANAKFAKEIMALKVFLRKTKKKNKQKIAPSSFSGVYTPVYAGEALKQFFTGNPNGFGHFSPRAAVAGDQNALNNALMNNLPYVQQGFLLRNTCTMLFFIYAHTNQLQSAQNAQKARSDQHMMNVFGGNIPALFFSYKTPSGKNAKVLMDEAVRLANSDERKYPNFPKQPLNTYQAISAVYPEGSKNDDGEDTGFNPAEFYTYFYQNISAANYYSKAVLADMEGGNVLIAQLDDETTRNGMLTEHDIVKQVSKEWHDIVEPDRKIQRDARKKVKEEQKRAAKAAAQ